MSKEIVDYFDRLQSEVARCRDADSLWQSLVQIAKNERNPSKIQAIEKLDFPRLCKSIEKKIASGLKDNPIGDEIKSIYFGLFDRDGNQGFYLTGSKLEKESTGEFLCDQTWKPTWGYFKSKLLNSIYQTGHGALLDSPYVGKADIELRFMPDGIILKIFESDGSVVEVMGDEKEYWLQSLGTGNEIDDFFTYFLVFGAAIAIVKRIRENRLLQNNNVFVGFDSGDFIEVK